jgi:TonB family protein
VKLVPQIVVGVFGYVCSAVCLSADPGLQVTASWRVLIDADGHVSSMTANDRLTEAAHAQIDPIVRRWIFIPGHVNGRPAETETSVTVGFTLVDLGNDKYSARIDQATTGGAADIKFRAPPKYPRNEMIKGHSGLAVLDVAYGTDGQVTDVKLADGAPAVADDFVKAASSAIQLWRFSPEVVGGHALAGHVVTPMCFTVERFYGAARPPQTLPPSPMCEWRPPGSATPLRDGEVMALAPVARLRDDVTTHAM